MVAPAVLVLASLALAAQDGERLLPGVEGPLANDCFLPVDEDLRGELEAGDAELARARAAGRPDDVRRFTIAAFEAWHDALERAGPSALLWQDAPHTDERRFALGVLPALETRLAGLSEEERELWGERFEPTARTLCEEALAAGDFDGLARVASLYPHTHGAARALLVLTDLAMEAGRMERARLLLARVRDAWAFRIDGDDTIDGALRARASALDERGLARAVGVAPIPSWEATTTIEACAALALEPGTRDGGARPHGFDQGVRPGLVVVSPREDTPRFVVQTPGRLHLVELSPSGKLERRALFDPYALLSDFGLDLDPRRQRRAPGWSLEPRWDAGELVLVLGRSDVPDAVNALAVARLPATPSLTVLGAGTLVLEWAIVGTRHVRPGPDGELVVRGIPLLEELDGDLEFQPGPAVVGDVVVAALREYAGDVRAWLVGFDRVDGKALWKTLVAAGTDLVESRGRTFGGAPRLSASPLTVVGGRVFHGTNLGAGALVEAVDGRPVWALRNRRRDAASRGWPSAAARVEGETLFWMPFDSDRAYALDLARTDEVLGDVLPVGESHVVIDATSDALVVQGRAGREETVSIRRPGDAARVDALYLGPGESFAGRGLAFGAERVLACTDRGLYLFDRTRDLYLLDYAALPKAPSQAPGGTLYTVGEFVIALGRDALWSFQLR